MDAQAMAKFYSLCKTVAARGKGLTMKQIGDASALAREQAQADPDMERVELLRGRLGLDAKAEVPTDASPITSA